MAAAASGGKRNKRLVAGENTDGKAHGGNETHAGEAVNSYTKLTFTTRLAFSRATAHKSTRAARRFLDKERGEQRSYTDEGEKENTKENTTAWEPQLRVHRRGRRIEAPGRAAFRGVGGVEE